MTLAAGLFSFAFTAKAENWPAFRGPTGQGVSSETNVPLHWSASKGVAWKTPIPGAGWSSPIVWGDRVFVTTATDDGAGCHVMALNGADGKVLWDVEVFKQPTKRKENRNSYATPTPVTDGKRVYVFFGGGGAAALDFDGKVVWTNQEHDFYSQHGMGASPVLYKDLFIMPFDGSSSGSDKAVGWQTPWDQSFVVALDVNTGKVRWKSKRGLSRIAHVTPMMIDVKGKPQLVSPAGDVIQGFNPDTGELLWTVRSEGEGVVPSVVRMGDRVVTVSGFPNRIIRAVQPGEAGGDSAKIVWEQKRGGPAIPSLIYVNELLFSVNESTGLVQCLDPQTGESIWQERIEGTYSASPVAAENRIYFTSDSGETTVIDAGREFKHLASNPLGEQCQASPAISQGRIFIRTQNSLFCIGSATSNAK
jgi:outer membrane protein assembly factor BamB